MGLSGAGDTVALYISHLAFSNHDCHKNPNIEELGFIPFFKENFWQGWNPVADHFREELGHCQITTRDIGKGEMITNNYANYGRFMDYPDYPLEKEIAGWCDE